MWQDSEQVAPIDLDCADPARAAGSSTQNSDNPRSRALEWPRSLAVPFALGATLGGLLALAFFH